MNTAKMFLHRSLGFCHLVLYLHLLQIYLTTYEVACYIENPEEELVQPNRIDEVSSNFECRNEGYFADTTYGCQFYHVCENTNSPYDKPSFVKHTFSCVNGTVFNQMSFTCTRYQDSIPCDASPNYFYLNKRNGDPKAYFLTDDDIVKPSANSKHAFIAINSQPTYRPVANKVTTAFKSTGAPYVNNSPVASSPRPVTFMTSKPVAETRESSLRYAEIRDRDYESNSLLNDNSYSHKASAPYELSTKYAAPSGIKPGVRYSRPKYEPVKEAEDYEAPRSKYISDIRQESSMLPRAEVKSEASPRSMQYRPVSAPSKMVDTKIGQFLVNYEMDGNKAPLSNARTAHGDYSKVHSHTPYGAPSKRAPFTPAAFSKMYMENQKAVKYHTQPASSSSTSSGLDFSSKPPNNNNNQVESNYHRQKLIESQPKMYSHFSEGIASKERHVPISKYEVAEMSSHSTMPTHGLVKSNQYVVPTSVRMMDSENAKEDEQELNHAHETDQNEPVKMAFVHKQQNGEGPASTDFSNLRVVKQVKGKNLLIDPSLENDPARDNIIAQVLEMLNKYN